MLISHKCTDAAVVDIARVCLDRRDRTVELDFQFARYVEMPVRVFWKKNSRRNTADMLVYEVVQGQCFIIHTQLLKLNESKSLIKFHTWSTVSIAALT
jgi:hypothetical protein